MGDENSVRHEINVGLDGSVPRCSCRNYVLLGIPCPEACALINRLGLEPATFIRKRFTATIGLALATARVEKISFPVIHNESLSYSSPLVVSPLLLTTPGRPSKKRKTKDSARRAFRRKIKRDAARAAYKCICCRQSGHTKHQCRSITDGRGESISRAASNSENALSIVGEIGKLEETKLLQTFDDAKL